MTKIARTFALVVLLLSAAFVARAAQPTLKVGDPAPKLQTGRWVQGEPVKDFEKGKAYIVEFWATWCGPCRVSIPHLNEIYTRFKDKGLVVIGQDCWETDEAKVEPFVKSMGEKMTYRVALDDKDGSERGKMADTWMAAAGQNGIPTAFIVDPKGIIAWISHPMNLKDELIESVLNGTHDIKTAAAEFEQALKQMEEWRAAQVPITKVYEALRKKDWAEADAKLAEAAKVISGDQLENLRLQLLLAKRDYAAVETVAEKKFHASSGAKNAGPALNQMAWQMATDPDISKGDLARAEKLATWAADATNNKDPMILDTLARVQFSLGKHAEAIALQEKAVKLAGAEQRVSYQQTLESYRQGKLPNAE